MGRYRACVALLDQQPDAGDPERLAQEIERTADRLRSMSSARLGAPMPDGHTRSGRAFALAQELTDRAASLAGRPMRRLPDLPELATGDVLAVCGHDLLDQVREHDDAPTCALAVEQLVALRRLL
jgi:hypothetical protein